MKKYSQEELKVRLTALRDARIYFVQEIEAPTPTNRDLLNQLYEIADCLEMALKDIERGRFTYPKAMSLVRHQLVMLVNSQEYRDFKDLGKLEYFRSARRTIIEKTKHHVNVMFDILKEIVVA